MADIVRIGDSEGTLTHGNHKDKTNELVDQVNVLTNAAEAAGGQTFIMTYKKSGDITTPTVMGIDGSFTSATGFPTGTINKVYLLGFEVTAATSSSASGGDFSIALQEEPKNSNFQHTVGAGNLVAAADLISSPVGVGVTYNAAGEHFFASPIELTADKMFFLDVTAAGIHLTDTSVLAYFSAVPI